MLNLNICLKCSDRRKYSPIQRTEDGRILSLPSVMCSHCETEIFGDSEIPEGCIYLLEQKLTEPESWEENEDIMEEVQGGKSGD